MRMCGIVAVTGYKKALPLLINGLEKLEYRGYDSAGIAIINSETNCITCNKAEGKLKNLKSNLHDHNIPGTVGIGHTRWATHGKPEVKNAHPHTDSSGNIAVVQNGIIENFQDLKNKLEEFLNLGIDILWKGLEEVEENNINGIVFANEVLDALPVERITFSKGKLLRQAVSIDKKSHKLFFDEMPITSELGKSIELAKSELGITIPPEDALEGWTTEWHIDNSKWLKAIYGKINNGILLIIDYAKEAKKYYTSKNYDGTVVSYGNQKMMNNVLDSPGNCDLTSHVCIETLINDAETLGFNTVGITKQGEALLALGLAERLYGIQKEFKENLSNALLRREALLRLVDPVCLGDFKWFVFKKFNEKKMNINSTCLR